MVARKPDKARITMKNPITAWSYSRLALYELCPLKFKLQNIDKVPTAGSPAMERGDKIHKGVAAFLQGKNDTLPADAMVFDNMTNLIQQIKGFGASNIQIEQQWGFRGDWKPCGWFDRGNDKVFFRSVLDAGVMYEDLTFEGIDWKTGKKYGSNMEQMETQAIAAFNKFPPITHFTARLAYLDQGEFEFEEFPATAKVSLQNKWAKRVKPMMTDEVFAPRPNDKCRFCDFSRNKGGQCAFG